MPYAQLRALVISLIDDDIDDDIEFEEIELDDEIEIENEIDVEDVCQDQDTVSEFESQPTARRRMRRDSTLDQLIASLETQDTAVTPPRHPPPRHPPPRHPPPRHPAPRRAQRG